MQFIRKIFLIPFVIAFLLAYAGSAEEQRRDEERTTSQEPEATKVEESLSFRDEEVKDPRKEIQSFFVGTSTCVSCHLDKKEDFLKTGHALSLRERVPLEKQGCEMCHGPGQKHVTSGGKFIVKFKDQTPLSYATICLSCHKRVLTMADWKRNPHSAVDSRWCVTCHAVHKTNRFLLQQETVEILCATCHESVVNEVRSFGSRHTVFESKTLSCTSCHNPHKGRVALLRGKTISETCGSCHADKVGPFTFEHIGQDELPGTRSCVTCHSPHGSPNKNLLRMNGRGLCLSCHTDRITHRQGQVCWTSGCHTLIHGSDTNPIYLE